MNVVLLANTYMPNPSLPKPVTNGYIYIGIPDTDPTIVTNQLQVSIYEEDGSITPVSQPLRTSNGGVPIYNSTPVSLVIEENSYSITVLDSSSNQEYYIPEISIPEAAATGGEDNYYYPDATETDQGVPGSLTTIAYYVSVIGAIDQATIYLRHSGTGSYTDYTFATSDDFSAYDNIKFVFENGARLAIDSGVTVTFIDPGVIQAADMQYIFTGDGSALFSACGTVNAAWYGLNDGNTAAQNSTFLTKAIDSLSTNTQGTVNINPGTYSFNQITIDADIIINGQCRDTSILQSAFTSAGSCVTLSAGSKITNLTIDGNAPSSSIGVYGAVDNTRLENVTIKNFLSNEYRLSGDYCEWINVTNEDGTTGFTAYTNSANSFSHNIFQNCKISGSPSGMVLQQITGALQNNLLNIHFDDNTISLKLIGTEKTTLADCLFENGAGDYITIADGATINNQNTLIDRTYFDAPDTATDGIDVSGTNAGFVIQNSYLDTMLINITGATIEYYKIIDTELNSVTFSGFDRLFNNYKYASNSNGNPNISDTDLNVYANIGNTFESVGPTGSGATNIWTALDIVPSNVDWIRVRIISRGISTGDTANIAKAFTLHARENGSSEVTGNDNEIAAIAAYTSSTGNARVANTTEAVIKVSSLMFDLANVKTATVFNSTNIQDMFLIGCGYN